MRERGMDISHLPSLEDHVRDKEILSLEKKTFRQLFLLLFLFSSFDKWHHLILSVASCGNDVTLG